MKTIILTSGVGKVYLMLSLTLLILSERMRGLKQNWSSSWKLSCESFMPNLPKEMNFLFTCNLCPSSLSCPSLLVNSTGKSALGLVMIFPCFFASVWLYYTVVSLIRLFVPHLKGKNTEQERSSTSPLLLCGDTLSSQFQSAHSSNRRCYY